MRVRDSSNNGKSGRFPPAAGLALFISQVAYITHCIYTDCVSMLKLEKENYLWTETL